MKTEITTEEHELIEAREYRPNALLRPRTKYVVLFGLCAQVVGHFLPSMCTETNLHSKLVLILTKNITSDIFVSCDQHNLFNLFVNNFVHFFLLHLGD